MRNLNLCTYESKCIFGDDNVLENYNDEIINIRIRNEKFKFLYL